jgi:hypothetical protein
VVFARASLAAIVTLPKVCTESLRLRPPAVLRSAAAAETQARDMSALRENLIISAKGQSLVFAVNDYISLISLFRRHHSLLADSNHKPKSRLSHACH